MKKFPCKANDRSPTTRGRIRLAATISAVVVLAAVHAGMWPAHAQQGAGRSSAMPEHMRSRLGAAARLTEPAGESVRIVVRSYETAAISAEINARITHLPAREGDRIRKGELLVGFDCRRIVAEHEAARAVYQAQRTAFETQRLMREYQAVGSFAVTQSRFDMEKAEAELRVIEVRRTGCTIHAPFDSLVVEKSVQVHEIAQPNQPLLRIANEAKIELVLMVPSSRVSGIAANTRFRVRIDETGETYEARIVQATGHIDPISQSARLIAEFTRPATGVLPGMSGTAYFTTEASPR